MFRMIAVLHFCTFALLLDCMIAHIARIAYLHICIYYLFLYRPYLVCIYKYDYIYSKSYRKLINKKSKSGKRLPQKQSPVLFAYFDFDWTKMLSILIRNWRRNYFLQWEVVGNINHPTSLTRYNHIRKRSNVQYLQYVQTCKTGKLGNCKSAKLLTCGTCGTGIKVNTWL